MRWPAARKGQSDIIVGGIVGSNIFNIFSVMAINAVVRPLIIEPRFAQIDLPIVLAVTAVFAFLLLPVGRVAGSQGEADVGVPTGHLRCFQYWDFFF